jgi:hypothetical protein
VVQRDVMPDASTQVVHRKFAQNVVRLTIICVHSVGSEQGEQARVRASNEIEK